MATTPNYGWVTPAPTDFVTDLPADFEIFADAVDASFAADEGDLLVGGSSDIFEPLAIGTNGTVLTSNGTTATWATPTATVSDFTLLNAGGTALTGATTITVSGIDASELLVFVQNASNGTANSLIALRLNTDTDNNYTYFGAQFDMSSTYSPSILSPKNVAASSVIDIGTMGSTAATKVSGSIYLQQCKSTGLKIFNVIGAGEAGSTGGNKLNSANGIYSGTSAITSVSVVTFSSNFDEGTVFVYGKA